jgi:hypothetical protein
VVALQLGLETGNARRPEFPAGIEVIELALQTE